jgi:outer membrane protein OmpA-like peptidoglycan-associated protein
MPEGYSWSDMRGGGTYRLPGPEHLGWWAALAMLFSILLHIAVFLALNHMKIALRFEQTRELNTRSIHVQQVEVRMPEYERATPEEVVTPPADASTLLEEIDLLSVLPTDAEIDIKPDIDEAEYALQMQQPLQEGDPQTIAAQITENLEIDTDLPEFGREPEALKPAAIGQVTIDPGSMEMDDDDLGKFTEEMLKHGAGGKVEKGALDGVASLDDLLDLPPNLLLSSKTLLPSDLLFDFNKAELRESAKVGLMKLALLMDRNPNLFCWIEGHTDLIGGDEFNLDLSIRRAEAVKNYLVESMRMDKSRIFTRGFGRYQPIVIEGDQEQQAINRRVEIRMRKTPPSGDQIKVTPQRAPVVEELPKPPPPVEEPPAPPRAVLVKPNVEEPAVEEAPRAVLIKPQRALPVEEPPPPLRAQPVEPPPLRAEPVEE